ncbi:MAG: replicative DNA helicase [Clostridia bacterium]|nr:replicative DNA helicase [Clostridia bacterium]
MANVKAKMMPHSIEAEQSVLCSLLIDENSSIYIMSKLKVADFYLESHQEIYQAMVDILNMNCPIDYVTLVDQLEKRNALEQVGGIDYIATLSNFLPSAVNHKTYVDLVKRDSLFRQLISAGQKIIEEAYSSSDKDKTLSEAERLIYEIAEKEEQSSLEHIGPSLNEAISQFDSIAQNGASVRGIKTGITEFDKITNGLQNSDLILLAARPAVGKTSFAMNMMTYAAIHEKKHCAVFSLEMPKIQIAQRSLCSVGKVSMEKAKKGTLSIEEWKSLWVANKQLAESQIYVDDSSMNTPIDILSKCRRLKREKGLDLVMIDYLQLMTPAGKVESRQNAVAEMTRYLKIAAKELNVPIILLSQLSRAVETRKEDGHRPMLSDLRESGSIEQDADIVLFLYKASQYNDIVQEDDPDICELIIAKHRNGETGKVKMRWVGEYTTFVDENKRFEPRINGNAVKVIPDEAFGGAPEPQDEPTPNDIEEIKGLFEEE